MIKINLLGNDTAIDYTNQFIVGAFLASIAATVIGCVLAITFLSGEIDQLTVQKSTKERELVRLKTITQKVKDLEKKQHDLEERLVRIATLKRNKQGPVKVLDALNAAIPERAWLSEAREKGDLMKLEGLALDGETISQFMRELEKSDYFPKVELDVAKQTLLKGVKIQSFSIRATVSYAGKIGLIEPLTPDKAKAAIKNQESK